MGTLIKYLKHSEIDRKAWDRVVAAWSGQPYALSWWLDVVSPGWEALVRVDEKGYVAVMPLPVKRRFGISYLVQPRFTQQLGIFGEEETSDFLRAIPYISYDININFRNTCPNSRFKAHVNYIINKDAEFNCNTKRNIKKADSKLVYREISQEKFLNLWCTENANRFGQVYATILKNLLSECLKRDMALILGAFYGDKLVGAMFAVLTNIRVVLLAPVSNANGKSLRAMFGLMSNIINNHSTKIIDCEGSMLPGVATFYRGFGGVNQKYHRVWRLSWRKKI